MISWNSNATPTSLFVESTNAEELRARRVWQFFIVLWFTWVFFAAFLWFRGYGPAARVCCIESTLLAVVIAISHRRYQNYRRIMTINLSTSAIGLFAVASSDPALYLTMLFYPVSILVASQLVGVRTALFWFIVNIIAFTAFFLKVYGFNQSIFTSRFDELVLVLGVAACIFFCCQQGEEYYHQRTTSLIKLSQDLQTRSNTLEVLATTDALTGLINRFQFQERLKVTVEHAVATESTMALFLVDMDGFKEINDTLGHAIGDEALVEIGVRLNEQFASRAEVARLGGDEFCIIFENVGDQEQAEEIASQICKQLCHRYVMEDAEFPLGASVGFALCPEHATTDTALLAYADTAMFNAKDKQLGHSGYERQMTDRLVEYRTVQEKLSLALAKGEFFLVYQPQVNLQSNEVIGVEALLRWRHDGEVIPPWRFIHLLEKSREILPVSNWIIREACRQLAVWNQEGYSLEVSINVSALQFKTEDFFRSIADPMREFGIDPRKLDFEITEGLLIDDVVQAVEKLNQIKTLGVSISIDDFGTGYSSLAYLREFPIDRLKIDRAFVKDIPHQDDGVIASSIVVLAKALGLKVIAEGVETKEQLDFIKAHDCDEYQGFYLSPPVGPEEVAKFFKRPATEVLNDSLDGNASLLRSV